MIFFSIDKPTVVLFNVQGSGEDFEVENDENFIYIKKYIPKLTSQEWWLHVSMIFLITWFWFTYN